MDDLFRFILLRPADRPSGEELNRLEPTWRDESGNRTYVENIRRAAERFLASAQAVQGIEEVTACKAAMAVREALVAGPRPREQVAKIVEKSVGDTLEELAGSDRFTEDGERLANTLVAAKLVSGSAGTDARALGLLAQGYDAIAAAAGGEDPVPLRPLVVAHFDRNLARQPWEKEDADRPPPPEEKGKPTPEVAEHEQRLQRLEEAKTALRQLTASSFATVAEVGPPPGAGKVTKEPLPKPVSEAVEQPWRLTANAVRTLPSAVRETIRDLDIDPETTGLPAILSAVEEARTHSLAIAAPESDLRETRLFRLGTILVDADTGDSYVGSPVEPMPSGHGSLRPVGIGDLLLVKQHVLRYEGGELAHVENVLKSESLSRKTRRLDRSESTITTEEEKTKEEERDDQSTDRFALKRETSETVKQDAQLKAGLSVSAKYGPFVEVKANAEFATSSSSEQSVKQASEFSKDVVSRSVSKVVDRVLERRTTTTLSEFEERYSHRFDNSDGDGNISGVYQWVDRVLQAQLYNYGKRMLFDVTVPEPATAYIVAQAGASEREPLIPKPPPLTLNADQINEGNYAQIAKLYDVTGLTPPPPPVLTVSKPLDAVVPQEPYESSKSYELAIEDGYEAQYVLLQRDYRAYDKASWRVLVGANWMDCMGSQGYFSMAGETGSVALAYDAYMVRGLAATIEVFCARTSRAMADWRLKTHAAITQGYLAKLQAYEQALAEAAVAAGTEISGRNPVWNQRLLTTELRKQCLTLLTAQQFDAFGALQTSSEGYPQPDLARSEAQMPYVRFFEQAFEWEHLAYFFYPYFWGWKPGWRNRMLLDDVDAEFADFLRAGAARVVFPVRPGFESAVVHYLETGEIWEGGPPPDISDLTYVPIVKEIQEAEGAPGNEVPVGEPWLVRLPTTLAKLRPDDELPSWHKVGEDWQPD